MIHQIQSTREYFEFGINNPDTISASFLERLKNPYEAYHAPRKESSVFDKGSLIDCLWLTPDEFTSRFMIEPENVPRKPTPAQINAAKPSPETVKQIAEWAAYQQRCSGRTIIGKEMYENAQRIIEALNNHPDADEVRKVSEPQVMAVAPLLHSGKTYTRKVLVDMVPDDRSAYGDALFDLKIWNVIEDEDIMRRTANWDIHMRAAFYLDTYNAAVLETNPSMPLRHRYVLLIAHWDTGEVKMVDFHYDDLEDGRHLYMSRLESLKRYREQGCPRYGTNRGIRTLRLPAWKRSAFLRSTLTEQDLSEEEIDEIPTGDS